MRLSTSAVVTLSNLHSVQCWPTSVT